MADINQVTVGNLGLGFDVGVAEPNKISVKIDTAESNVYTVKYAGGSNLTGTAAEWARNSTLTRDAQGLWSVVFDTAHPDGTDYHPSIISSEDGNRDTNYVSLIDGSKTANGFSFYAASGDNGGGADVLQNSQVSYSVSAPVSVVTGVSAG